MAIIQTGDAALPEKARYRFRVGAAGSGPEDIPQNGHECVPSCKSGTIVKEKHAFN